MSAASNDINLLDILETLEPLSVNERRRKMDELNLSSDQRQKLHKWLAVEAEADSFLLEMPIHLPELSESAMVTLLRPDRPATGRSRMLGPLGRPGDFVGRFRLLEFIASGAFGEVWKAVERSLDTTETVPTCIKLLYPDHSDLNDVIAEARTMAAIRHENVVGVREAGRTQVGDIEVGYIEMELVGDFSEDGQFVPASSLAVCGAGEGKPTFEPRKAGKIMVGVCRGVHAAHLRNKAHRDLKPENILIEPSTLRPKVVDFGIASAIAAGAQAAPNSSPRALGTPAYMAPEQARDPSAISQLGDVYALGATLYFLLAGHPPYQSQGTSVISSALQILEKVKQGESPIPLPVKERKLPRGLVAICEKAMSADPDSRYRSAAQMGDDLAAWMDNRPTEADSGRPWRRAELWCRRHPAIALLASAATILLVLGLMIYVRDVRKAQSQARGFDQMLKSLEQRLARRKNGWSAPAWNMLSDAVRLGADREKLSQQAAATLIGLDAVDEPRYEKLFKVGGWSLAFDPTGRHLLVGGLSKDAENEPAEARLLLDGASEPVGSGQAGLGPVVFRKADGFPLQLVWDGVGDCVLWHVSQRREIQHWAVNLPAAPKDHEWIRRGVFSADGTLVAHWAFQHDPGMNVVVGMGRVSIWNTVSGKLVIEEKTDVTAVGISADARWSAFGLLDRNVVIRANDGSKTFKLTVLGGEIRSLAFGEDRRWEASVRRARGESPPGWIAVGEVGGRVTVWDVESGLMQSRCGGAEHVAFDLAFFPDSTLLAAASRGKALVWETLSGRHVLDVAGSNVNRAVTFSPDGKKLVAGSLRAFNHQSRVYGYGLENGRGILTLRGLDGPAFKFAFSADSSRIAAISTDWRLGVWDCSTGRLMHIIRLKQGVSTVDNAGLALSPTGRYLAVSVQGECSIYDLDAPIEARRIGLPPGDNNLLAFRPDGSLLIVRRQDETETEGLRIHFWNLLPSAGPMPGSPIALERWDDIELDATANGSHFLVRCIKRPANATEVPKDGLLLCHDGTTGKFLWRKTLRQPLNPGPSFAIDPGGHTLVAGLENSFKPASLLDLNEGRELRRFENPRNSHSAMLHIDAVNGEYETVDTQFLPGLPLYRVAGDRQLTRFGIDMPISSICPRFDALGRYLAWGNADGTVNLADLKLVRKRFERMGLEW